MPTEPIEVFVSYRWRPESVSVVEDLQIALRPETTGIKIIRDNEALGYKADIAEFMKSIGRGKFVVLVLSHEYFQSRHCMNELVMLSKHSDFVDRIFPVILPDAKIYNIEGRLDYRIYWQDKKNALNEKLRMIQDATQIQEAIHELNLYDDIMTSVLNITDTLTRMNAMTLEAHRMDDFKIIREAILAEQKG